MNNYFNTNNETGERLKQSESKAEKQKQAILKIFQRWGKLTASEAWKIFDPQMKTPLTSTRRAITNLCYDVKLVKTKDRKMGLYGSPEHYYKLIGEVTKTDKNGQITFL